ncbi:UDP-glucose 4-epimerase [Mycoplasmoides pneumoniae FH]|uniref:UDP-glucose 4-epimerase n=1 Tax=Mycoplasmoides pneumoniae (strain ATCC 15531 / DSM 23978 / CIP 103766 / NBRC 14401 / NCTC 10119 / FH) TaxID=722438 RepID=A0A0H3DMX7_MYCPB|nr:UDP-glucose 4-epimerase [Mycoplasmoides pneumoniae FH]
MSETKSKVLVLGGLGYIGSCFIDQLLKQYPDVTVSVIDINHTSLALQLLPRQVNVHFVNLLDRAQLTDTIAQINPDVVFHFAAKTSVKESTEQPLTYFDHNLVGTLNLLHALKELQKPIQLFFSSTAAVFGSASTLPIPENLVLEETLASNPYGISKFLSEIVLQTLTRSPHFQVIALRYFNVAGASNPFGNFNKNTTLLIPNLIKAFMEKRTFFLYGDDYDTKDGSCIRDYIHVVDLCDAHLLAWKWLQANPKVRFESFNLGSGQGFSNWEVINTAQAIFAPEQLQLKIESRKAGDPPVLVVDCTKAKRLLNFQPTRSLHKMLSDETIFYRDFYNRL